MEEKERLKEPVEEKLQETAAAEVEEAEAPEDIDHEAVVVQEILNAIRSDESREKLAETLSGYHDADIAKAFPELSKEERKKLYTALGVERTSEVFAYLEEVEDYFREIGAEKSADILEEMDADDAVDILEQLPEEYRDLIVEKMDEEAKEDIELITSYEDGEVGSMMTTNFIVIERGLSVKAAMKELIRQSGDNDNISTIYVTEKDGTFYGAIDLKDLIRAREGSDLESIITTSYPYVGDHDDISDEIERLRSYSEDSIPVLDKDSKIIGVITANDLVEAVDDELGEDYAKLAGLTEEEDLNEPLFKSVRKRLPWLIALLGFGLVVSSVVGIFQGIVAVIPLVICFQSLILDMAGNSGTQSLAVTIRVLTDESLNGTAKLKFVLKEMRVGFTNGCILGLSAFGLVGAYIMVFQGKAAGEAFLYSGCVGLALWTAMIVASMVGTLIPMFFNKIKVDPAVASGPLITTINDLIAVVTYYGMAGLLLVNVFHLVG